MKCTLWIQNTPIDKNTRVLIDDFLKRLPKHWHTEIITYKKVDDCLEKLSDADTILFDENGKTIRTQDLAQFCKKQLDAGAHLQFVLGPTDGFTANQKQGFTRVWSLSNLTFTRDIALFVLSEQLYRAYTILQGHPYHKE